MAGLLAALGHSDDALTAYDEAGEKYAAALKVKPDKHEALNNWGVPLSQKAWLLLRRGRCPEGLAALAEAVAF